MSPEENDLIGLWAVEKQMINIDTAEPEITPFYPLHFSSFQNLVPTLSIMQLSHQVTSLEAIPSGATKGIKLLFFPT